MEEAKMPEVRTSSTVSQNWGEKPSIPIKNGIPRVSSTESNKLMFDFLSTKEAGKFLFFIFQEEARWLIEKAVDVLTFTG